MQKKSKIVFGTKEWAPVNANCVRGCSHDCRYCYAKAMSIRFKRHTPKTWRKEVVCLEKILPVARMAPTRVMFPTTHDITENVLEECVEALRMLLNAGHEVLLVSKPHKPCIGRIVKEFKPFRKKILFRFSIGSVDDGILSFWEPGAPLFKERLDCLKMAFENGFRTSVSCEPMLDGNVETLVDAVKPFVTDSIWIGKMNSLRSRMRINGCTSQKMERMAEDLLASQTDGRILDIYRKLKNQPLVRWKESIKKVVGIDVPTEAGLDA